ncbi:acyltransferase family protein [Haloplasma contractile]|uniref:Glucans biosynthesis protein n=1 Tax=Haloplasma contractile SSD-17B TaxID=1033810 RepID=U2EDX0_9MOLU|nr:acyltransferase family protein [Haloplasma contractile]ERJ13188.1 Glucans biosynthesis protein [Haloplasma contractile SSD-17B]
MLEVNSSENRMAYVDHIRLLVITLVVFAHANMTYSGVGSWYYMENSVEVMNTFELLFFGVLNAVIASFSMGLLFLLAGYFVPVAYDRKGFFKFIKSRVLRLLIPTLIYVFLIQPFICYILLNDYYGYKDPSFFQNIKQ